MAQVLEEVAQLLGVDLAVALRIDPVEDLLQLLQPATVPAGAHAMREALHARVAGSTRARPAARARRGLHAHSWASLYCSLAVLLGAMSQQQNALDFFLEKQLCLAFFCVE